MSCASRRVSDTFIRGCGSSSENASVSGLVANFCAIVSNGGASATSLRWPGATTWQVTPRFREASAVIGVRSQRSWSYENTGNHRTKAKELHQTLPQRSFARPQIPQGPAHTSYAAQLRKTHASLMQIKTQRARPASFTCMKLFFDLKTSYEKICSLLDKSAQTCAEIAYHVLDAELAIKRIEQQLRDGAPGAGNLDLTPRIAQQRQKRAETLRPSP
jgi:hypothetical protein